ncbi:MAG: hypothetical protein B6D64_13115 [Bacteroidetes bacterium 4484_276]|nr:MAG: hypothetical protein B6D64_13115 [Bacteroidetes bacterium 4484_276]
MLESDDGKIWIGTENGLNCLDPRTGKIKIFLHNPADSTTLSDNWINYLYQDRPGRILACTPTGVNVMNAQTGKVVQYKSSLAGLRNTPSNNINFIGQDSRGDFWVGSDFGVVRYDTTTRENVRYLNRPDDPVYLTTMLIMFMKMLIIKSGLALTMV